jgi:hypothetical protein
VNGTLLLDNSAWVRLAHPALLADRLGDIADALEAGRIAVCPPFLLETGYSSRNAREHDDLLDDFRSLPHFQIDESVERRAVDALSQLARGGHHRLPPVDLIMAAIADRHGLGVLHYDRGYDLLREKTDLAFDSVWLADRGTLDERAVLT